MLATSLAIGLATSAGADEPEPPKEPASDEAAPAETSATPLRALGFEVQLPGWGVWTATPTTEGTPDALTAVDVVELAERNLSFRVALQNEPCEAAAGALPESRMRERADRPGWVVQWDAERRRRPRQLFACHERPGKTARLVVSGTVPYKALTPDELGELLESFARALSTPALVVRSTGLVKTGDSEFPVTTQFGGLDVNFSSADQFFVPTERGSARRVLPVFPAIEIALRSFEQLTADRSCGPTLEAAREQSGGEISSAPLPKAFVARNALFGSGVITLCEDFSGGHQLHIEIRSEYSPELALTSLEPSLTAIHLAYATQNQVEARIVEPRQIEKEVEVVRAAAPKPVVKATGQWVASTLGATFIHVSGSEIGNIGDTTEVSDIGALDYWIHLRSPSEIPVSQFAQGNIGLGAGFGGGFYYDTHLLYGVAFGVEDHYLGLGAAAGFSGFTGNRLDFALEAGLAASVVTTFDPLRLVATVRETYVTGEDRQSGSSAALLGDELAAELRLVYLGDRRRVWSVVGSFRQVRDTSFFGIGVGYGLGMAAH